jgi:hypothetical protein
VRALSRHYAGFDQDARKTAAHSARLAQDER